MTSFCLIVDSYSRMRPQPVQVKLQACSGSSIRTIGNFLARRQLLLASDVAGDPGGHLAAGNACRLGLLGTRPVGSRRSSDRGSASSGSASPEMRHGSQRTAWSMRSESSGRGWAGIRLASAGVD